MFDLDPAKLLVILVVGIVVLGPERLPQMARQAGSLWADIRRWRKQLEDELRGSFPDLPPTHEVVRAVRSPVSLLNRLADAHEVVPSQGTPDPSVNGSDVVTRPDEGVAPAGDPDVFASELTDGLAAEGISPGESPAPLSGPTQTNTASGAGPARVHHEVIAVPVVADPSMN
jgi:Sec-independent protein translocase protein TatA